MDSECLKIRHSFLCVSATTIIKIKGTNDNMRFIASVSGSDWKDETFNKYGIKYSDRSTPSTSGNQYL